MKPGDLIKFSKSKMTDMHTLWEKNYENYRITTTNYYS